MSSELPLPSPLVESPLCQANWETLQTLWRGAGSFLQLAVRANKKAAFGKQAFTWIGAGPNSALPAINHGLGATPVLLILTPVIVSTAFNAGVSSVAAATFVALASTLDGTTPAAGTPDAIYWFAIA